LGEISHPFFRASFPNFVVLVNPGVDVVRHLRGFPKWYIRKYSVWHFLRNRPIVVIFDDFYNKLTILALFVMYSALFWPKVAKNIVNNNFKPVASFTMGQKFLFSKSFFVASFDQNRLDFALFYKIKSKKSKIHWVLDKKLRNILWF
jgi:hypothetical protein